MTIFQTKKTNHVVICVYVVYENRSSELVMLDEENFKLLCPSTCVKCSSLCKLHIEQTLSGFSNKILL